MTEHLWRGPGRQWTAYNRLAETINEMNRPELGAVAPELPAIPMFAAEIDTLGTDRLLCIAPGDANTTPEQFAVFLPPVYTELSRPFADGTVSYVYANLNQRTASGPQGPDETQYLEPPLLVGERILTIWNDLISDYMMLPDGRLWSIDPP